LGEPIHAQHRPAFRRIIGSYGLILGLSSLCCVLATLQAVLALRPRTSVERLGQTLLPMSFLTSFTAIIITTILLFSYESVEHPMRIDLVVACSPIVLFDMSAVLLLAGTSYSSRQRIGHRYGRVVAGFLVGTLAFCTAISCLVAWRMSSGDGDGT
jgi:hypothetical protein